jgi:DNA-binding transcriptional LysR family regulator
MEVSGMICFFELARHMSFSAAAEALYFSQSAFSKRIQSLERDLGTTLFIRTAKGAELTEAGRAVLPYAREIVEEYGKMERALREYRENAQRRLKVYSHSYLAHFHLLEMLLAFGDAHPEILFELIEVESSEVNRRVLADPELAGIVFSRAREARDPELTCHTLCRDKLAVLVGAEHPLAAQRQVERAALNGEHLHLIHHPQDQFLHEFIREQCGGVAFAPVGDTYDLWTNRNTELIRNGSTVAILPMKIAEYAKLRDVRVIPVADTDDLLISCICRADSESDDPLGAADGKLREEARRAWLGALPAPKIRKGIGYLLVG